MTVLNQLIAELLEDAPKVKQYTEDDKVDILIEGLKTIREAVLDLNITIQGLDSRRSVSGYENQCEKIKDSFQWLERKVIELDDPNLIKTKNNKLNKVHKQVVINSLKKSINTAIEEAIN